MQLGLAGSAGCRSRGYGCDASGAISGISSYRLGFRATGAMHQGSRREWHARRQGRIQSPFALPHPVFASIPLCGFFVFARLWHNRYNARIAVICLPSLQRSLTRVAAPRHRTLQPPIRHPDLFWWSHFSFWQALTSRRIAHVWTPLCFCVVPLHACARQRMHLCIHLFINDRK